MGEIEQKQKQQQQNLVGENRSIPIFSLNQNHQLNYEQQQHFFQLVHNLPTNQHFFHYHQHHFQALLQQQQQQYQEQNFRNIGGNNATASVPCFPLNFKPNLNQNGAENGVLFSDESEQNFFPETRSTALAMSNWCQNQEDSAIRQPFWKPCTDLSHRSSESKDKPEQLEMNYRNKFHQYSEETEENSSLEASGRSRLFGELEAICGPAAIVKTNHLNPGSETSIGDEEPSKIVHKISKKRKMKEDQVGTMTQLFGQLVKQLMDHQEILYKKFVEMIERLDKERKLREETWRQQELEKLQKEKAAKAHEQALASNREASIIAYLERITGLKINIPPCSEPILESNNKRRNVDNLNAMNKRWPKAEVEALIQIRSRLESKFQEPGVKLKGPFWEEISNSMKLMGFERSAKRCKEKWENINKYYFKKSKEINSKERHAQKMKTNCQYFDQLDQLYSKSVLNSCYSYSSSSDHQVVVMQSDISKDKEELQEGKHTKQTGNGHDGKEDGDEVIGELAEEEEEEEEDGEGDSAEEVD